MAGDRGAPTRAAASGLANLPPVAAVLRREGLPGVHAHLRVATLNSGVGDDVVAVAAGRGDSPAAAEAVRRNTDCAVPAGAHGQTSDPVAVGDLVRVDGRRVLRHQG